MGQDYWKKSLVFPVWDFVPQASKQRETYFATKKFLQDFEGHDH